MSKAFVISRPIAKPEITLRVNQVYRINGNYYVVNLVQKNRVYLRTVDIEDANNTQGQMVYNFNDLSFTIYDIHYVGMLEEGGVIFKNPVDFKHFIPN